MTLVALALGRTTVSFQFQSITALAQQLKFEVTPSSLGVLLGIYMAPGIVAAVVTPSLIQKLGWRTALFVAFVLMALGQSAIAYVNSLEMAYGARFLAGTGGCVIYVLTVGLVAQLENSGPLQRRMGIIATSWPAGNALALVILGTLSMTSSLKVWIPLAFVILAGTLILWTSQTIHISRNGDISKLGSITLDTWWTAIRRGFGISFSFALYNLAFILLTSFSPALLSAKGLTASGATTVSSLPMWLFILSVPLGGFLAGRFYRYERTFIALGCFGSALMLCFVMVTQYVTIWYIMAGLLGGLPTAPMWARAGGREDDGHIKHLAYPALFFVFFASLIIFPPLVGFGVEKIGSPEFALVACSIMLIVACIVFLCVTHHRALIRLN